MNSKAKQLTVQKCGLGYRHFSSLDILLGNYLIFKKEKKSFKLLVDVLGRGSMLSGGFSCVGLCV